MHTKSEGLRLKGLNILLIFSVLFSPLTLAVESSDAILPVPRAIKQNPDKVALGKALFSEKLFSKNNTLSCASCHSLDKAGTDSLPRFKGQDGEIGNYNTPTVYNASLNTRQFWDGRANDIAAVIEDHVQNRRIFDNTWPTINERIQNNANLKSQFAQVFDGQIDEQTISEALTAYINSLVTPNSSFDQYLQGDENALSDDAKKGYALFIQYGCMTCHQGPNLGGNLFQKMGIYQDYFKPKAGLTQADLGRLNVTGKESDRYVFKVPGLRNVAHTAPYLHDGSVGTLEEVIALMGIYEVGQPIPSFDIPYIVKFLESLNGPDVVNHASPTPEP